MSITTTFISTDILKQLREPMKIEDLYNINRIIDKINKHIISVNKCNILNTIICLNKPHILPLKDKAWLIIPNIRPIQHQIDLADIISPLLIQQGYTVKITPDHKLDCTYLDIDWG